MAIFINNRPHATFHLGLKSLVDLMIHTNEIIDLYGLIKQSTNIIDSILVVEMPPINSELQQPAN